MASNINQSSLIPDSVYNDDEKFLKDIRKNASWNPQLFEISTGEKYEADDSDSDSDEDNENDEFENPPLYVPIKEDDDNDDDGFDFQRSILATLCRHESSERLFRDAILRAITQSSTEILKEFNTRIENNRLATAEIKNKIFEINVKVLGTKLNIFRTIEVPGAITLAALEEKVICPSLKWFPDFSPYIYLLPAASYKNGRRPLNPELDVSIGPVEMILKEIFCITYKFYRGGNDNMMDGVTVSVKDVLFQVGDELKLIHGNKRYLHYYDMKLTVKGIRDGQGTADEVRVVDGAGYVPCLSEQHYWDYEGDFEEQIHLYAIQSYCISLNIIKNPAKFGDSMLKEACRKLGITTGEAYDETKFDIDEANANIKKMLEMSISNDFFMMEMFSDQRPKNMKFNSTCRNCNKSERSLSGDQGLKRCAACHDAIYCSRDCQKEDWKNHKEICFGKKGKK